MTINSELSGWLADKINDDHYKVWHHPKNQAGLIWYESLAGNQFAIAYRTKPIKRQFRKPIYSKKFKWFPGCPEFKSGLVMIKAARDWALQS